jgi:hypothetical protein
MTAQLYLDGSVSQTDGVTQYPQTAIALGANKTASGANIIRQGALLIRKEKVLNRNSEMTERERERERGRERGIVEAMRITCAVKRATLLHDIVMLRAPLVNNTLQTVKEAVTESGLKSAGHQAATSLPRQTAPLPQ